jgi:hypothetical protein
VAGHSKPHANRPKDLLDINEIIKGNPDPVFVEPKLSTLMREDPPQKFAQIIQSFLTGSPESGHLLDLSKFLPNDSLLALDEKTKRS